MATMTADEKRIATEKRIVRRVIKDLADNGYNVTHVWDGEEIIKNPRTVKAIIDAAFAVDISKIYFGKKWILLVGGNGEEIISDYTWDEGTFSATIDATLEALGVC